MSVDEKGVDRPSRSARKRDAKAVEALAGELAELTVADLARLPVSPEILKEIRLARGVSGHGARKRQVKYLAGVLRRRPEELADLQAFLAGVHEARYRERESFHCLEVLRDRLCAPGTFDAALREAQETFPGVDAEALTRLARACHAAGDRRAYREIFRRLRAAQEASGGENA